MLSVSEIENLVLVCSDVSQLIMVGKSTSAVVKVRNFCSTEEYHSRNKKLVKGVICFIYDHLKEF